MLAFPVPKLRKTAVVFGALALAGLFAALAIGAFWIDEPEETHKARRLEMVLDQIESRDVKDKSVLKALRKVPRHRFVPAVWKPLAYTDGPLPIGNGQTISQPYIVALMSELIKPTKTMRMLEIGTGSGYQAAVLAECVAEVDSIEVVPELGRQAKSILKDLGYDRVRVRIGDGYGGWPERGTLRRHRFNRGPSAKTSLAHFWTSSSREAGWWLRSAVMTSDWCFSPGQRPASSARCSQRYVSCR